MISLYTFKELLIPENRTYVHPIIFDLHYFEGVDQRTLNSYQLVDRVEAADFLVFPLDILSKPAPRYKEHFKKMHRLAIENQKKMWVYTGGDYGKTIRDSNIITWRLAGTRSKNAENTIIIPSFINDPIQHQQAQLKYLNFKEKPSIAFTGFASSDFFINARFIAATFKANLKRALQKDDSDLQSYFVAPAKRYRALKCLESSTSIETDFVYRGKYRDGAVTISQRQKSTQEFFSNLVGSAYTLCMRGSGNFSVRFYESLACGRIPILIDTDVVLPLENIIDWDNTICRVDPQKNIVEQILNFHHSLNSKSFIELQKHNRDLFTSYLVRHSFFDAIYNELQMNK